VPPDDVYLRAVHVYLLAACVYLCADDVYLRAACVYLRAASVYLRATCVYLPHHQGHSVCVPACHLCVPALRGDDVYRRDGEHGLILRGGRWRPPAKLWTAAAD
jgi:hypothetical protein